MRFSEQAAELVAAAEAFRERAEGHVAFRARDRRGLSAGKRADLEDAAASLEASARALRILAAESRGGLADLLRSVRALGVPV